MTWVRDAKCWTRATLQVFVRWRPADGEYAGARRAPLRLAARCSLSAPPAFDPSMQASMSTATGGGWVELWNRQRLAAVRGIPETTKLGVKKINIKTAKHSW